MILKSLSADATEMNLVKISCGNTGMTMNQDRAVRIITGELTIELTQNMSACDLVAIINALRG